MEKEILRLCSEKVQKWEQPGGNLRQQLLARCARYLGKLSDDDWEGIPVKVQKWANKALEALKAKQELPDFPGVSPVTAVAGAVEDSAIQSEDEDMVANKKASVAKAGKAPLKGKPKKSQKPAKKAAPITAANGAGNGESKPTRAKTNPGLGQGRKFVNDRRDHKIFVEVEANPKREGSAAAARFELYKNGMTVEKALDAGITALDISFDLARDYIRLEGPKASEE